MSDQCCCESPVLNEQIQVLKALADPNRLRIFWLFIHIDDKVNVSEAMHVLQLPQYEVSKHLKQLNEAGLLFREKQRRFVYYRLKRKLDPFRRSIVRAIEDLSEDLFTEDAKRCRYACLARDELSVP